MSTARCVTAIAAPRRAMHLIDLENVLSGHVTPGRVEAMWQTYATTVGLGDDDAVVVAMARRNAAAAVFTLPAYVRRVVGQDVRDGADRALVDAVDVQHAATRFNTFYIASADHYFTDLVITLRDLGCRVTQVIGHARVSADLYRACSADIRLNLSAAA